MHTSSIDRWVHDHAFGQDRPKSGERRTIAVTIITALAMAVEIAAGILFGSMALLADGLHMGTHAMALLISAFAYYYTRKYARDKRFSFGTGKVNSLAAFASAVLLVVFAAAMAVESVRRFLSPVEINFDWAIVVAVAGLAVNGLCLLILGSGGAHHHGASAQDELHAHEHEHGHEHAHDSHHEGMKQDHNLWSAYLHVAADALTSFLAIFALLAAKYFGLNWLDPLMGIVGAVLVTVWSVGLIRASSRVLLDIQASGEVAQAIRASVEGCGDDRITDLHLWSVGPGIYAAEFAVVSSDPKPAEHYKELVPHELGLVHITVEVLRCPTAGAPMPRG